MTASVREQILEHIAGTGIPATGGVLSAVPGVTVWRSRQAALERSEGAAIVVQPSTEKVENKNAGLAIRDLVVELILIYRSDTPDQSADPTIQAMFNALTQDQTLGGLADRIIEEGTEWRYDEADLIAMEVSLLFRIRYMTTTQSLTSIA